ncbi:MAG: flagellar biosynthesis regulator FlaF, partial [Rhodospirillales bacterium]
QAQAFAKAARLLDEARTSEIGDIAAYAQALSFNRTLWTVLQADLADRDNPLPDDLKAQLMSLSIFVDRRTIEAQAYPDQTRLTALIDIDRDMAAGLFATG